jgi:hypothetical protein
MVGTKSAALFASRMSNERSADELRPRKLERVNGVAPVSQPWRGRILLLNYTRELNEKCRMKNAERPGTDPFCNLLSTFFVRVVRASGNAPELGTDLVRFRL